jgi:hypothetical protein
VTFVCDTWQRIEHVPNDYIATAMPNYVRIDNDIYYESGNDFKSVVGASMPTENYAVVWSGMLNVQQAGDYTFYIKSDDGSHLWIDGSMVVDNGGLHGTQERSGAIALAKGFHAIKVDFFESDGGSFMVAEYQGPDTNDERASMDVLHFKRGPTPSLPDPSMLGMYRGWMGRIFSMDADAERIPTEIRGVELDDAKPDVSVVVKEIDYNDEVTDPHQANSVINFFTTSFLVEKKADVFVFLGFRAILSS